MSDAADLRAADALARERALRPDGSFIVQAPAGSGKTELLTQRFLRLLSSVERPEEILAITFTNKAAAEMRERIVSALRLAACGNEPEEAHRRLTAEFARAALARGETLGWSLLEATDRLRIQTVDAFCRELASKTPLAAGVAAYGALLGEADANEFYRSAAARVLDWLADDRDRRVQAAVDRLLTHLDDDAAAWSRQIGELLAIREQWLPLIGMGTTGATDELRTSLESALARRITTVLGHVERELAPTRRTLLDAARSAAEVLDNSTKPQKLSAWLARRDWPAADPTELGAWRELAEWLLTRQGSVRSRLTVNDGFDASNRDQRDRLAEVLVDLAQSERTVGLLAAVSGLPDPVFDDAHWAVMEALMIVLPLAAAELDLEFAERGVVDFSAVAGAALAALGDDGEPSDLALLLDYRLKHLLVDEMQDTSLMQYALLRRLTAGWQDGDGRTLFCVGDPMQSIYRFREADVGRFLTAMDGGIGDVSLEPLTLCVNFRSSETVVDWCNRTFRDVFPPTADALTGAVPHAASVAAKSEGDGGSPRVSVHPVFDVDRRSEAVRVADIVAAEIGAGRDDIAILAPSRASLLPAADALRERGVPYDSIEVDELAATPGVQPLLAIVRALAHPLDRIGWLGLLRAPWVGLSLDELLTLCGGDPDRPVRELLRDPECLAALSNDRRQRIERLRVAIEQALDDVVGTFPERVEAVWYRLGGPRALRSAGDVENAYRLLDLLRELSVAGRAPDAARLAAALARSRVSSVAPGDLRVRLMTVHKAKGLEFDCVVLTGLGRTDRSDGVRLLRWLNLPVAGEREVTLISLAASRQDTDQDPLHRYLGSIEAERGANERDRLLYVAATRAKRRLHLVGHAPLSEDGSVKPPPKRALLARLWPGVASDYETAARKESAADQALDDGGGVGLVSAVRRLSSVAHSPSAPALPAAAPVRARAVQEPEFAWVGALARHVGVVTHLALETLAAMDDSDASIAAALETAERHLVASSLERDERRRVMRQCARLVRAAVADSDGHWLLFGEHRQCHSELALSGRIDGDLHSVVLDRVVVDQNGTHWIVDYKTGWHGGGDTAAFLEAEAERYAPQLERYRILYQRFSGERATTALYYPSFGRLLTLTSAAD